MLFDVLLCFRLGRGEVGIEHRSSAATREEIPSAIIVGTLVGQHSTDRPDTIARNLHT